MMQTRFLIIFFSVLLLSSLDAQAQALYVVKGDAGVITFTSRKPSGGKEFKLFNSKLPSYSKYYTYSSSGKWSAKARKSDFDNLILNTSGEYAIDPALVKAVMHVESCFNPKAISPKGAMGLMQLMPGTADRFGVNRPYRPEENIKGGVAYLKMLYDRYDGNERLAVAAYNAGEGAVDKIREVPPYKETQVYVRRVLQMKKQYSCDIEGRKISCG